ncbi:Uncharacterised protein [Mycobacteroides abscessus]|nr:Uncharacterised protein [Mycobacteroides abscessus]
MPASAHAATSGSPYFVYGPTVVNTTCVDAAMAASVAGRVVSASISGQSRAAGPQASRTAASFSVLRPASAILAPVASTRPARYKAVSFPTYPVAPYSTMSCSRDIGYTSSSRSSRLRIFPDGLRGKTSRKTTSRGTLYRARLSRT